MTRRQRVLTISASAGGAALALAIVLMPGMATEGGQLGGATVIIQYTQIKTSRFLEAGSRPPYVVSTGSGRAVVLRDGQAFEVHWSRPAADGGTTYTLPSGQRMLFAPGQVWVILAAAPG
jgi:Protein of unknown function (DUF3048) C-terminal domain